jgi:chromosomal replication initiator protein
VPSQFFYEYLEEHFRQLIYLALYHVFGRDVRLVYQVAVIQNEVVREEGNRATLLREPTSNRMLNRAPGVMQTVVSTSDFESYLNLSQNFDNFLEGTSNRLPRSVGQSVADYPARKTFNPLFIYGPSGCGKTHLVNAIGLKIKELHPELRVLYVSAHLFMVQYVDAKLNNKINQFIQFYQTIDVLIIDDIQELSNKEKTQNTFFHIFNHLHMNGKQIILTADRPPVSIIGLEDRLLTRFKWGLQAEIEKPTKSLRYSILTNKVNKDGLLIPEDVISFIAENVNESIRDLEGFINALLANSIVHRCDINMALVNKILRQFTNNSMKEISFEDIKEVICEHYHVSVEDLCSRSRKRPIANIRQVAIFLADKYTELSTVQIGKQIGGRNHATVIHSVNQIRNLMDIDAKFRNEVDLIETKIKGRSK